ncbi:hypothetical protein M0R45_005642 [Rubus argutus]|uniref:COX assembly mitochondrial protein n=1 Tax=Rubus argutus TaxID=59490 RepID=A0AAW1YNU5_RUBAR
MASLSVIFSLKRKVESLERRSSKKKKSSCSMIDYLCDKFQAADKLEKIDCVKLEDHIKECIFKWMPADQYDKHIREIRGNTLNVIGDELIKFEKELKES